MGRYIQAVSIRWYNACAYYAVELARSLALTGNYCAVLGDNNTPAILKARNYGIETIDSGSLSVKKVIDIPSLARIYRKFALEKEITLVNVHTGSDQFVWSLALRGTGIPLIKTSGNQIPPNINIVSKFMMKKAAGVIATCRTIRDYYSMGFGINEENIPVINGGIDTEYFDGIGNRAGLRKSYGIPEEAYVFGIVGRFSPDKGHEAFFDAAGKIAKEYPGIYFVAAGWSAQYSETEIKKMAESAGITDRTIFLGKQKDSRDIISILDAGVIASVRSETICRIAMEYMSMGLTVIASDTNVIPEVIRDGVTGLIFPAGNSEKLADCMRKFIDSREFTEILGRRGRETAVKDYSPEAFSKKTLDAYRRFTVDV